MKFYQKISLIVLSYNFAFASSLSIFNNPYQYSNQYRDSESNLDYLSSRYYDSDLMRFSSRDNYDLLNRYAYADGSPIMNIDPSGHFAVDPLRITLAGMLIFAAVGGLCINEYNPAILDERSVIIHSDDSSNSQDPPEYHKSISRSSPKGKSNNGSSNSLSSVSLTPSPSLPVSPVATDNQDLISIFTPLTLEEDEEDNMTLDLKKAKRKNLKPNLTYQPIYLPSAAKSISLGKAPTYLPHNDLINKYNLSVSNITVDMSKLSEKDRMILNFLKTGQKITKNLK